MAPDGPVGGHVVCAGLLDGVVFINECLGIQIFKMKGDLGGVHRCF